MSPYGEQQDIVWRIRQERGGALTFLTRDRHKTEKKKKTTYANKCAIHLEDTEEDVNLGRPNLRAFGDTSRLRC